MNIITILLLLFATSAASCVERRIDERLSHCAIWSQETQTDEQQYVVFRKTFELNSVDKTTYIQLFANARYLLWINGTYIMRGPCRFHPSRPEYDTVNIAQHLQKGKNSIVVLVHHYGNCINGRIMKGQPALTLRAVAGDGQKELVATDETWRYTDRVCYQPASASWNTVIDHIDGRIDGAEWIQSDYDDSEWNNVRRVDASLLGELKPNEMPLPKETNLKDLRLLPTENLVENSLPITLKQGEEIVVDYRKMALVYTRIKLDATENSTLSMRFALRYKEGKPHEEFGEGNRYIARSGVQEFMTTDQWGSHYMVLTCDTGEITLQRIQVIERAFPFERLGSFHSNDTLLNNLWSMAVNTIEATSDDAYGSDARERNEWIQDGAKASFPCSRIALASPVHKGKSEMSLLKNIIRHAALSQLPDGRFRATYPTDRSDADCHYFIDDYACQWFEALHTYLNMTGDTLFAHEMLPHLEAQLRWFSNQKQPNGLYLLREYTSFDNPFAYTTCQGATVNGFLYQAFTHAQAITHRLGNEDLAAQYKQKAEELFEAYNKQLWNETEQAYNSAIWKNSLHAPTSHAQLIALQSGLVPEERQANTRAWFLKHYKNAGMKHCCDNPDVEMMVDKQYGIHMPIVYYWVFNELYRMDCPERDQEALDEMRRRWLYMVTLQTDAGTLSESFVNADGGGSHESCHNYGVIPAYYLSAFVLGVRTEKPVEAKEVVIEPRLSDLTFAEGTVITEHGPITVCWRLEDDRKTLHYSISLPPGITATLRLPMNTEKSASIPGIEIGKQGRWIVAKGIKETCSGTIPL